MAYNKVTYKDEILMDITDSTVTPETLSEGVIAYGANGERIVGTATGGGSVSAPLIVHSLVEDGNVGDKKAYKSITIMAESVGEDAFADCKSLESVELIGVKNIGRVAFQYCQSLTSINIPDSVKSFGDSVFYQCSSLTNITIPAGVTELGYAVFDCCDALTEINFGGTVAEWETMDTGVISRENVTVHCSDGDTVAKYGSLE